MPTIPSVPATFSSTHTVTFAIPGGVYTDGTWSVYGNYTAPMGVPLVVTTSGHSKNFGFPGGGPSSFTASCAVSVAQLADINTAAGGSLTATFTGTDDGSGPNITAFTLMLTGGLVYHSPGTWYDIDGVGPNLLILPYCGSTKSL